MRLNSYDLHRIQQALDVFDERGFQVDGRVFIEDVGEITVEYDGLADQHFMVHFTAVE